MKLKSSQEHSGRKKRRREIPLDAIEVLNDNAKSKRLMKAIPDGHTTTESTATRALALMTLTDPPNSEVSARRRGEVGSLHTEIGAETHGEELHSVSCLDSRRRLSY